MTIIGSETRAKIKNCQYKTNKNLKIPDKKIVDPRAYTFCVLDQLRVALKRRDVFVHPSWRYADPRSGLLSGSEWETARQTVASTLGYSLDPKPALDQLAIELDQTWMTLNKRH